MARVDWIQLQTDGDLDAALSQAQTGTVLIFKHSTRCPVSGMALRMFERDYAPELSEAKPYFLDLIAHRPLSNRIAHVLQVEHESPQLIVVKNGQVVHTASHHMISAQDVKKFVE